MAYGALPYAGGALLRPFADEPGRWEDACRGRHRQHAEAASPSPRADAESWAALRRIDERTAWGWLRWQIPDTPTAPQAPAALGILPPAPSRTARLARRWLTRRPSPWRVFGLPLSTAFAAALSFLAGLHLVARGVPLGVVLPAGLLVPLCVFALPERLDAASHGFVRVITTEPHLARLQHFVVLHDRVTQAAAVAPVAELEQAVRLSHRVLWDTAGLLTSHAAPSGTDTDTLLTAYERLLSALAAQAEQAAKTRQDLDRTVSTTSAPHTATAEEPQQAPDVPDQQSLLPVEALVDAVAALGEVTAAQQYATACLRSVLRAAEVHW
jgi:hypothetical protein